MSYPTDLTDSNWKIIAYILDDQRKRKYSLRSIFNAILYLNRTGVQWRMLPKDFPPYGTVSYYYHKWRKSGKYFVINRLLVKLYRKEQGRCASPSVTMIDSQTVKHSLWGQGVKGFDGHKRIKGRKRHITVDTLGLVLVAWVTVANRHDVKAGKIVFKKLIKSGFDRLRILIGDSAYESMEKLLAKTYRWTLKVTKVSDTVKGFHPVPQRWKVERTFAWLNWNRRIIVDYERLLSSSQAMVYIANSAYILRKL